MLTMVHQDSLGELLAFMTGSRLPHQPGFYQSMALALWPYGPMALCSFVFYYENIECEFDSIFVVYSTRIRVNIVSKNARIHAQSSRSFSEREVSENDEGNHQL